MGQNFEYDEAAAGHADDFANRIDEPALYIGKFIHADAIDNDKGTKGIAFELQIAGGATTTFSLYTEKGDGTRIDSGFNRVQALMTIFGLRTLKTGKGMVRHYDDGKWGEVEGECYPELLNKDIGCALGKELFSKQNGGGDSWRMTLEAFFHPTSKFTASELRERKAKPEKLEKIQKTLKVRDKREKKAGEPEQPSVGMPAGEY